ncbi:hypothetical protein GOBAR_AA34369 [Gossypium barbadense]|uniref:Uncharacterized protein n=1 Tax=Gossypium barbadense TaxID=3634 RepID=A0A2P5W5H1_GOSBA|nr:hypothetical protein GOBAR_AA34369 [Gossypium barbadense]
MEIEGDRLNHSTKTNSMVQHSLQEMSLKEGHESFSRNSRGPIHEDRRLQIEELDECELTLRVGDEKITLQARNSSNTMEIEGDRLNHSTKTNSMVQHSLQEMSLKEGHESFSRNSRGPIHEDRRLQIEELDECQTHKPRTPDKPNLR